jgi:ribulose-5-phosphate 4-epimerase/fuculose-1-phosphate aldolase
MIDEGYIKFESNWTRTVALDYPEIDELIYWRKPLYAAGLIGHYADIGIGYGNISIRLPQNTGFIISGTQTGHLQELDSGHFALVSNYDIGRNIVSSTGATEASSESMTHAAIYELDDKIRAVVHVHSDKLWVALKGVLPTTNADIAYGTPQMASEFYRLFSETEFAQTGIAVMAGHDAGLISIGRHLQEATERILVLHEEFMS